METSKAETTKEIIEATEKAGYWLHLGNLALERGEHEKAERHYERAQKWHDKMINLSGEGDSSAKMSQPRAAVRTRQDAAGRGNDGNGLHQTSV